MQADADHNESAPKAGWQFNPGDNDPQAPAQAPATHKKPKEESVSWTASEFIAHQKNAGWYLMVILAGFLGGGIVFFLTHDKISAGMVLVVAVAMAAIAARKPRTLQYQIDGAGIHIGQKSYPFADFKAFSLIDEGALNSIDLLPLKRFMPSISLFFDPQDEDRITDLLSSYLPFQEGQKDPVDRFMHRIRF